MARQWAVDLFPSETPAFWMDLVPNLNCGALHKTDAGARATRSPLPSHRHAKGANRSAFEKTSRRLSASAREMSL